MSWFLINADKFYEAAANITTSMHVLKKQWDDQIQKIFIRC